MSSFLTIAVDFCDCHHLFVVQQECIFHVGFENVISHMKILFFHNAEKSRTECYKPWWLDQSCRHRACYRCTDHRSTTHKQRYHPYLERWKLKRQKFSVFCSYYQLGRKLHIIRAHHIKFKCPNFPDQFICNNMGAILNLIWKNNTPIVVSSMTQ